MEINTSDRERLEKIKKALKWKFGEIESYTETGIKKGVAVTSLFEFKPAGNAYSKCFMPELYKDRNDAPQYMIPNETPSISEEYDKKKNLWVAEEKAIKNLNQISSAETNNPSYKRDYSSPVKLAPDWYGSIREEKRLFMEPLPLTSPTYRQKFVEIDKKLEGLYGLCLKNDENAKNDDEMNSLITKIKELEREKRWHIGEGLFYVARFNSLCNKDIKLFEGKFEKRSEREIFSRQKSYLTDMLMDYFKDKDITRENISEYLKKEKKINFNEIIHGFINRRNEYLEKYPNHLSLIHGDFGTQHLTLEGVCFDFDELRLDLPQDDVVRFLNNEFTAAYDESARDKEELDIPFKIADYFIDRKRFEEAIPWREKDIESKKASLNLISKNNMADEFRDFLIAYYSERIEEDIHIYSINKAAGEKRLAVFAKGHPKLQSLEQFQKFRIDDINRVISLLLTREGREKILGDPKGTGKQTEFFESIRSVFERSGIMKGRFREDESGLLDL